MLKSTPYIIKKIILRQTINFLLWHKQSPLEICTPVAGEAMLTLLGETKIGIAILERAESIPLWGIGPMVITWNTETLYEQGCSPQK